MASIALPPEIEFIAFDEKVRIEPSPHTQFGELVGKSRIRKGDDQVIGSITVSVGVATVRAGEPAAGLVERADAALDRSKQEGRNRVTAAD